MHFEKKEKKGSSRSRKKLGHGRCFSCNDVKTNIVKRGRTKKGKAWALCGDCSRAYRDNQTAKQSLENEMGWNGIPSEKSLKARNG